MESSPCVVHCSCVQDKNLRKQKVRYIFQCSMLFLTIPSLTIPSPWLLCHSSKNISDQKLAHTRPLNQRWHVHSSTHTRLGLSVIQLCQSLHPIVKLYFRGINSHKQRCLTLSNIHSTNCGLRMP